MAKKKLNGVVSLLIVFAVLAACFAAILIFLPSCTKIIDKTKERSVEMAPMTVMDTTFQQVLITSKDDVNYDNYETYVKETAAMLGELEEKVALYDSDSQIYQLNNEAGMSWVSLDPEIYSIVEKGMEASSVFEGRFNISLGAISRLWNIAEPIHLGHKMPPTEAEINRLKPGTDPNDVTLYESKDKLRLRSQVAEFDVSPFIKGHAADKVINYYKEKGVKSAWVSLGGFSYGVMGTKPNGSLYDIDIKDPRSEFNVGSLNITDAFINTTGDYEQYYEYDGTRYCNVIDPKTLSPVQNDMMSVTVVGASGIDTNILSNVLFVGGMSEITPLLSNPDYKIIAITKDKNIYVSDNLKSIFTFNETSGYTLK